MSSLCSRINKCCCFFRNWWAYLNIETSYMYVYIVVYHCIMCLLELENKIKKSKNRSGLFWVSTVCPDLYVWKRMITMIDTSWRGIWFYSLIWNTEGAKIESVTFKLHEKHPKEHRHSHVLSLTVDLDHELLILGILLLVLLPQLSQRLTRWAYSIPVVCHCRPHFQTLISLKPIGQSWSNFMCTCSITGLGQRLRKFWGRVDQNTGFHGNR